MATPPTRVSYNVPSTGNFSASGASKVTTAFDVQAGDLIVVMASSEQAGTNSSVTPSASGGSVTWTLRNSQTAGGANQSGGWCWTGAVGATATGITVTCPRPNTGTTLWWGFTATVVRNHGGVGVSFSGNNGTGSGAPSVAATCAANSLVVCQVNDWNAVATARTWRTINGAAETESLYFTNASHHTVYGGYRADSGAAGSITQGLTAPSNQRWIMVGVEILGTSGATTHALTSTGTGTSTGSCALSLVQSTSSTGTGTTTGSAALLLAPGAISATGTGTTTGSVNLLLAPGALSATGTGQTDGSAALSLIASLSASGTAQTAGSVDVTLNAAPLALSATGGSSSTGSLAVNLQLSCSSTGTGTSTGSVDLTIVGGPLSLSATGTGQTGGSAALTATLALGSTGSGSTTGSAALISTLRVSAGAAGATTGSADAKLILGLSATGTGQTAGSLDVTVPFGDTYSISATGTGASAGSLDVTHVRALSADGAGSTAGSLVLIRTGQLRAMGLGGQTSGSLVLNLQHKLTASGSAQTAGSMAMRISLHRLSSTGYTFTSGSCDLRGRTYTFSLPTHEEPMRLAKDHPDRPLAYFRETWATSLVNVSGTWTPMRTPPPELLAGKTAGVDYFLGGFEYVIDQQTARSLALAGYPSTLI